MRFFLFPTAMVRPSSSLAKFSVVISNIPFPQFSSPPLYNSPHPPLYLRGNRSCCGAILPDLEDADPALSLCPVSGVKRTLLLGIVSSAYDPKRTSWRRR